MAREKKMRMEAADAGLKENAFWYGFTSSKVISLESALSHKVPLNIQEEQFSVLGPALLSLLKPLSNCSKTEFEVTLKDVKLQR